MAIEHRWSERKPIEIEVALHYSPIGTVVGKTRDVSLEGMFVRTNGVELPVNSELEVSFSIPGENEEREHRLPAYVVHGNGEGVGLMLRHSDYRDFHALRHMLGRA